MVVYLISATSAGTGGESVIVEMGVCLEISRPVAVIFIEKMLVARAVAHAHEPGSGDELSECLRCSGLNDGTGQGGK
jgi:hypothetical protein